MEFINGDKSFSPQEWLKALFLICFMKCLPTESAGHIDFAHDILRHPAASAKCVSAKHRQQSRLLNCVHGVDYPCAKQFSCGNQLCDRGHSDDDQLYIGAHSAPLGAFGFLRRSCICDLLSSCYPLSDEYKRSLDSEYCYAAHFLISDSEHCQYNDRTIQSNATGQSA